MYPGPWDWAESELGRISFGEGSSISFPR
jgi:hypothetical protein